MDVLGLGAVSWWWIAILATAVFLVLMVPEMPTREYRIRTALAPFAMAVFALGSYAAKQLEEATVLAMYTSVVLIFPLGAIGHRKELARRLMEAKRKGESEDRTWPPTMVGQTFLAAAVMVAVYCVWIAP
ncbi:hypothetical protein P3T27_005600 [Kitasatospora sp. MAA19]|uniref:hypothetical protein n=1 Tax=Kitasatospora sp. MAA19 TaxID=3035090 RepID=UPI002475988B|nr:hypothetical protein [Kitasatospora sp. MAA19]MDH6708854.1 hypothetical protein [Kitasatospora sp. MAA19]